MNLFESIDKSSYTLLFSGDDTERSYEAPSGRGISSPTSTGNGCIAPQPLAKPGNVPLNPIHNGGQQPHTVLNMRTTLVNGGKFDNCDMTVDCERAESLQPLLLPQVNHGSAPTQSETRLSAESVPAMQAPSDFSGASVTSPSSAVPGTSCYVKPSNGIENDTVPAQSSGRPADDQVKVVSTTGDWSSQPKSGSSQELTREMSNWGPENTLVSGDSIHYKTSCSDRQPVSSASYFVKDYSNIFGNIANSYETEDTAGKVAKLDIKNTSQESKMFLIGLSSNADEIGYDDDDDEEQEMLENDDQNSSNSPFHSATEDVGGDGDHERGDQDPLLVRQPPKQNVFHQFIRSATKSTKLNRRPSIRSNGKHSSFRRDSSSRASSSSALIKEVHPPNDDAIDDDHLDDPTSPTNSNRGRKCSIGILLAAISCVFFATSALIVKISDLHPMELLAVRGLIQGLLISPIVISTGNSFMGPSGSRSLLLARAVLGAVALVMGFASIHLIQLSDAATVIFTSPVFVSIFACICLGEVCSWFDVSMIALTLVGVLLVSKPSFSFISTGSWTGIVGTICGLIAAMLTALAFIVLRQLKQVHYSVVVFWFSSVLALFGAVLTIALDGFTLPRTWAAVMECIGIGFCGFMGQVLLTKALQSENALPIAVTRTFDIVLAFFFQITLLHDTPDWYSYLGSVLVVSCVLLTAFRRWYKESITKKYQRVHKVDDDNVSTHDSSSPPPMSSRSGNSQKHQHQLLCQESDRNFS